MTGLAYGYVCFACGVLAHIFYIRLLAAVRKAQACERCGNTITRSTRHAWDDRWYCGPCIRQLETALRGGPAS